MKTIVIEAGKCPSCGKTMPAGALAGLCPSCLLAQGFGSEPGEGAPRVRFEPPPLEEVARLFPQLEIQSLLGAGGMGAVYQARQPALDRVVALKILPAANTGGVNFEERFNREARALARLNHPNIVAVYEFGRTPPQTPDALPHPLPSLHFFIMEFVDGANLRQLEKAGRLSPREALQIIPQICDALQYAHDEGVVHRDIKPENVLVDRRGRVKIADFGLAKILGGEAESSRLTLEGQVMGTPHYMAPEQVEKPLAVDHRADIYALGVVFYEMLTGDLPLGKFSPPSRKVEVDVRLDDVVLRALENDPARRYQRASEVKTQVESIVSTPASAAESDSRPGGGEQFVRWAGFCLARVKDGIRTVQWAQVGLAGAVMFGVLTMAFGVVTLLTGRSLFGWVGVVGWPSFLARLAIAAGLVGWGVWRALKRKIEPECGTTKAAPAERLPAERFSRKAVIGACWIPFIIFALATFVAVPVSMANERSGPAWWQIALAVLTLPLAFSAPFGSTLLGWLAVSDIRRARGRLAGLPLAVFVGLFYPLLVLDGMLLWIGQAIAPLLQRQGLSGHLTGSELSALVKLSAILICLLVDVLIVRRVWRAVRLDAASRPAGGDWWWSRKLGALTILALCLAILIAAARHREQPGIFKSAPEQVAVRDGGSGALVAYLPLGGKLELLAVGDPASAGTWWQPNGRAHGSVFVVQDPGRIDQPHLREKELIFRFTGLGEDSLDPMVECNPGSGFAAGGEVLQDGQVLRDARAWRFAWPEAIEEVTMRLGVGLVPWRKVASYQPAIGVTSHQREMNDPNWNLSFHQAGDRDGHSLLTVSQSQSDGKWQTQMVAVDQNGAEHRSLTSGVVFTGKMGTWTYSFALPLNSIKEFRMKARPLHWVEFRKVILVGEKPRVATPQVSSRVQQVAKLDAVKGRWVAALQPKGSVELLAVAKESAAPNEWWNPVGEALPDTLFEIVNPEPLRAQDRVARHLILRLRDLPNGADGPQFELPSAYGSSGGRQVLRDGKPLHGAWLLTGYFSPGATQGVVRLGFGLAEPKTMMVLGKDGNLIQSTDLSGVPRMEARVHQVSEANGEAQVTMLLGYSPREWQIQVVAVDLEGKESTSVSSSGSHAHDERVSVWSYKFWRLPLARVKEFRIKVRPIEWVEFRDIPLEPAARESLGQSGRTLQKTAWSGEWEVSFPEFYDFDRQIRGAFPTAPDGSQLYRNTHRNPAWARERGFDVEAGTNQLHLSQMFIIDLQSSDWDSLSIPEFERRMNVYYGPPVLPSLPGAPLPLTYGFRTAEGTMGILQITAFVPGQAGVKLRYKRIERARFD